LSYFFIRPQIGIKKEIDTNRKNKFPISYEYGAYFRYNMNGLGQTEFIHTDNYREILQPKGHVVGVFFQSIISYQHYQSQIKNWGKNCLL
jgi:hypothetical protein